MGKGSNPNRRDIFSYHLCNCHSVIYEIHMHTYSNNSFFLYFIDYLFKIICQCETNDTILMNETSRPLQ